MFSFTHYFLSAGSSIILSCLMLVPDCTQSDLAPYSFPYEIDEPSATFILKKTVNEVSGLYLTDSNEVALIDDEKGSIFFLEKDSDNIVRTLQFSDGADWEDLVIKGDSAFTLRSDGTIALITGVKSATNATAYREQDTPLNLKNDTEGMCFDSLKENLFIACKGMPGLEGTSTNLNGKKTIYKYNIKSRKFIETPAIIIDENHIEARLHGLQKNLLRNLLHLYSIETKNTFQPSGIALHPLTKEMYVISSTAKALVVLDTDGSIRDVIKLPRSKFKQPEGITFDSQGNMYISNEGRTGKGNVLKFILKKKSDKG